MDENSSSTKEVLTSSSLHPDGTPQDVTRLVVVGACYLDTILRFVETDVHEASLSHFLAVCLSSLQKMKSFEPAR